MQDIDAITAVLKESATLYERKACKGLCVQLDKQAMCMGLCSTEPSYVQRVYDNAIIVKQRLGEVFLPIPYYEERKWVTEPLINWLGNSATLTAQGDFRRFYLAAPFNVATLPDATWCAATPEDLDNVPDSPFTGRDAGPNIMPVYLKALAPLTLPYNPSAWLDRDNCLTLLSCSLPSLEEDPTTLGDWLSLPLVQEQLRHQGFDSVQLKTAQSEHWLGLSAAQFKSALGNSGLYIGNTVSLTDPRPRKKPSNTMKAAMPAAQVQTNTELPSIAKQRVG